MIKDRDTVTKPFGFLFIISLFILFTVLLASGGLYFYKGVVAKNITSLENTLNLAKNRFEPTKISELQVLDKRLRASTEILSKHIAVTPIFKTLEQITMKTIRFNKFSYEFVTDKTTTVNVKMSGQAIGYRSIALQSDLFAKNKNLINPIFSNLTLDNSGNVLFDLDFSVDSNFVNYKQALLTQN